MKARFLPCVASVFCAALVLAACGGGGGDPPPPTRSLLRFCDSISNDGELTVGAGPTTDFVGFDACNLYQFFGTAGIDYTVTLSASGDLALGVAFDSDYKQVIGTSILAGPDVVGFTATATQTYHIVVFGFEFPASIYAIDVASP